MKPFNLGLLIGVVITASISITTCLFKTNDSDLIKQPLVNCEEKAVEITVDETTVHENAIIMEPVDIQPEVIEPEEESNEPEIDIDPKEKPVDG